MKRIVLFIACALALVVFSVEERFGFRFWERLSFAFDEFSVDADGTLRGRLDRFTESGFFMKIGTRTSYVSTRNRPFVLQPGEALTFWRSRGAYSSICVLQADDPLIKGVVFPAEMRGERRYIRIKTRGMEIFVGVVSQKAYLLDEKVCMDFPLPFKSVWPDQKDHDLWVSGGGFRPRFKKVAKISEGEKQLAADLFGYFSSTNLSELVGDSYSGGATNVKISAASVPARVAPGLVEPLVIQIDGTNAQLRVSGFSFVTHDGGCRRARRCRIDSRGRLVCGWRVDRANDNGKPGRVVLDMSFEYDADGMLRRAWTPGSNPLMIDKGNKLYFTGDRDLVIKYREEIHQTLAGLPWLK